MGAANHHDDLAWSRLDPRQVHAMLDAPGEWALLDVRELGAFDEGHAFWAANAPLSHLETRLPRLVPRRNCPVVLMDDADDGLAARAAQRLAAGVVMTHRSKVHDLPSA